MMIEDKYVKRFLSQIDVCGEDDCWNWLGRTNKFGVGIFVIETFSHKKDRKAKTYHAHILAYKHFTQTDPDVRYFDRECDNPLCCNPNHIVPRDFQYRLLKDVEYKGSCWLRTHNVSQFNGYASIFRDGESVLAHRASYEHFKGEIPEGMIVRHTCHNRICINPNHLRLGTHEDNMRDMTRASRQAKGEDNGNSQLTVDDVIQIKELLKSKQYKQREIAEMFSISRMTVTDINTGRTWAWL